MEIIETSLFTRQVQAALSDEEFRAFQLYLIGRPDVGDLIPGSGGLRKVRWGLSGRGKRGGARVIYYWQTGAGQMFLLFLYPKNVRSDLSPRGAPDAAGSDHERLGRSDHAKGSI